jgi:hypothetical protein
MNTLPAARRVSASKACVSAGSGAPMLTVTMSVLPRPTVRIAPCIWVNGAFCRTRIRLRFQRPIR